MQAGCSRNQLRHHVAEVVCKGRLRPTVEPEFLAESHAGTQAYFSHMAEQPLHGDFGSLLITL